MKEVNIILEEYMTTCGDGCCTDFGTIVTVNGVETPSRNDDTETILKEVLEHLGFKVNIERKYDY